MIKHENGKWILFSKDGSKQLGEFDTEQEAKDREAEIVAAVAAKESYAEKRKTLSRQSFVSWLIAGGLREADFEYQDTSRSNIADWLESTIHKTFTVEADGLLGAGHIDRDERIMLSGLIGDALSVFSAGMDVALPELRTKPIPVSESYVEKRDLTDVWARDITEATIDESGNLGGIIVVEGKSKKGNIYTKAALESGRQIFAGKPIFADHPSRAEDRDRPERSVRDLVGKLPADPVDLWVAPITEGPREGKNALFYRNGILSETADWLKTLIREKIAGAQSINALGGGDANEGGDFVVEAFLEAKSLDFVTSASAGGEGHLQESANTSQPTNEETVIAKFLESLTIGDFAKLRPDIIDGIGKRERSKAYGEKSKLVQEATMSKKLTDEVLRLRESVALVMQQTRRQRAAELTNGLLSASSLPTSAHAHVRRLVEAQVRRFVEQDEPVEIAADVEVAIVPSPDLEPSDPPTIEVPAEVPEDKRTEWVTAYLEATEAGTEPAQAVHVAWAAIIEGGEAKVPEEVAGEVMDVFTEAKLGEAIRQAIVQEAQYVSTMTGAGRVMGMGGISAQALLEKAPEIDEAAEVKSWQALGLSESEARVAHAGRGRNINA